MAEEEKNKHIFTGPELIAQGLIARLQEISISPIVRNEHQSATRSGFAVGFPGQVQLFIRNEEYAQTKSTIDTYLDEIKDE